MIIKVVYYSSTGNTRKLAEAIASACGIGAEPIGGKPVGFREPVDLLFIGGAIYFGKPNKKLVSYISELNPRIVKKVAVFATHGGQQKIAFDIQALLQEKGVDVVDESYVCKGQAWALLNRGHPNEAELNKAHEFAKNVLAKCKE